MTSIRKATPLSNQTEEVAVWATGKQSWKPRNKGKSNTCYRENKLCSIERDAQLLANRIALLK